MGVTHLLLLPALLWAGSTTATPNPISITNPSITSETTPYANHVFNSIHSSMRQWGSSLQHNGMTFYLASVPAGTQFYHGTSHADAINGTEWLAFEPEHAMVFARPHRGPRRDKDDEKEKDGDQGDDKKGLRAREEEEDEEEQPLQSGWLHTYTAAKELRLLYVDGMAAGKTPNGTLDVEDRILFRDGLTDGNMMGERERATHFCQMAREEWDGRLDGLLRMEAGFEVILCDFGRDLNEERVTMTKPSEPFAGPGGGKKNKNGKDGDSALWLKAIAARYDGIGGGRVQLNYDHFVSAYTYGLDLFQNANGTEKYTLPRLTQFAAEELEGMRADLVSLIREHEAKEAVFNWQAVADMVVERYAKEIRYLASGQLSEQAFRAEVDTALAPFVDYGERDAAQETERCAMQFIARGRLTDRSTAANAVHSVTRSICATLVAASQELDHPTAVAYFAQLMEYLAWSTWKQCSGCADHEICVVPIWPMGTVEDYNHPQCRDALHPGSDGEKYWGGWGPGGRKPPGGDDEPSSSGWGPSLVSFLRAFFGAMLGMNF
ncbi:hypothetical protein BO70DRAFT_358402 [Aspergillus heteromorphus CBS 117.55]|uniref:Uncharacterized protein n=1 Tax=Aspergillus heteromorphus CBS 117.55 TaxID=1448321 RepID=A0A317WX67_9EURO|nr:uncharacterized protein BO70DRAFT_358402 [Aspergillus heteromorphus CBS 117.55]PWY90943.1 hypothetical protein BO70DRAFT_358402 [Aspergillus heteromorphus CBS 117.55]